jgi:hypothetical protein
VTFFLQIKQSLLLRALRAQWKAHRSPKGSEPRKNWYLAREFVGCFGAQTASSDHFFNFDQGEPAEIVSD